MTDPRRVALILRVIAGEVVEAQGALMSEATDYRGEQEAVATLDIVQVKLRDLADTFEAVADG